MYDFTALSSHLPVAVLAFGSHKLNSVWSERNTHRVRERTQKRTRTCSGTANVSRRIRRYLASSSAHGFCFSRSIEGYLFKRTVFLVDTAKLSPTLEPIDAEVVMLCITVRRPYRGSFNTRARDGYSHY